MSHNLKARIESIPNTTLTWHPRLLGFFRLTAPVWTPFGRRIKTIYWGVAVSEAGAVVKAEAFLEYHGAIQRPPEKV